MAQDNFGAAISNGAGGLIVDRKEAFKWFRRSARQGCAGGQLNLGVMYDNGWGVEQDKDEAYRWFERAAAQGLVQAKQAMEINRGARRNGGTSGKSANPAEKF